VNTGRSAMGGSIGSPAGTGKGVIILTRISLSILHISTTLIRSYRRYLSIVFLSALCAVVLRFYCFGVRTAQKTNQTVQNCQRMRGTTGDIKIHGHNGIGAVIGLFVVNIGAA